MIKILSGIEYSYQYFFFRIYRHFIWFNKLFSPNYFKKNSYWRHWYCAHSSALTLTILFSVIYITIRWFVLADPNLYSKTKPFTFVFVIIIHILNCLYFLRKKKFLDIDLKFSDETLTAKLLSSFALISCIVIIIFFYLYRPN